MIINCQICYKEFYAKPSQIKKGNGKFCSQQCTGINNSMVLKGYKHTNAFCKKISIALKGVPKSKEHRQKIGILSSIRNKGSGNPRWKGGKSFAGSGHIYIYSPEHPFKTT